MWDKVWKMVCKNNQKTEQPPTRQIISWSRKVAFEIYNMKKNNTQTEQF